MSAAGALTLFGATGDLANRYIWPSLYNLHADGLLPPSTRLVGAARQPLDDSGLREAVSKALDAGLPDGRIEPDARASFLERVAYAPVDAGKPEDFEGLKPKLENANGDVLYYLSTSPSLYGKLCNGLAGAGLAENARGVVIEKPIGTDLASSVAINEAVTAVFDEDRVFRVDHYLGKETVQNLLALRFGNILFEPLWNAAWIEHVQITIAESVGVEGRWGYYDQSGALRDMVQNHLLQLMCLVAMEPPAVFDPESVRNEKIKVLRSLRPIDLGTIAQHAVAGQYASGNVGGDAVPGYADEAGGGQSRTETFVALKAHVDNWRWAGVPFFLRTGKRMPQRRTEILVQFKCLPHNVFQASSKVSPNVLRILLQPQETVELTLMTKEPGLQGMKLKPVNLDLSLTEAFASYRRRIAYERLILDALHGDGTLFVRRDEVEAAWTWIDGITQAWTDAGEPPKPYAAGTWGPTAAIEMIVRAGYSWAE